MDSDARIINQEYCIFDCKLLGKGSTGNVYLGFQRNSHKKEVAIKVIDLASINNPVTKYLLSCQIAALSNLGKIANSGHRNVVKLDNIVIKGQFIYLVMENLKGGMLSDFIKDNQTKGIRQNEILSIFRQILQGYQHIKRKNIIHRDLKPSNILFKNPFHIDLTPTIIDFGYCQMEEVPNKPQGYYNVGSPKYMSPQAYKSNKYSQKSDIWALGIILYELLLGKTCDQGMNMQQYMYMIQNQGISIPNNIPHFYQKILRLMLHNDPQKRASCSDILSLIMHQLQPIGLSPAIKPADLNEEGIKCRMMRSMIIKNQQKNDMMFKSLILSSNNNRYRQNLGQNDLIKLRDMTGRQLMISNDKVLRNNNQHPNFNQNQHLQLQPSIINSKPNIKNFNNITINLTSHQPSSMLNHAFMPKKSPQIVLIEQKSPLKQKILTKISNNYNEVQDAWYSKSPTKLVLNTIQANKSSVNYKPSEAYNNSIKNKINFTWTPKANSHNHTQHFQLHQTKKIAFVSSNQPLKDAFKIDREKKDFGLSIPIEQEQKIHPLNSLNSQTSNSQHYSSHQSNHPVPSGIQTIKKMQVLSNMQGPKQTVNKSIIPLRPAFGVRCQQELQLMQRRKNALRANRVIV